MRFPIPLVVELDTEQLARWADASAVAQPDGNVRAKDAVEAMREQVVAAVRRDFGVLGVRADISVRR